MKSQWKLIVGLLLFMSGLCRASILPEDLTSSQIRSMDAQIDQLNGVVKGALIVPNGHRSSIDGKYNRSYHGVCYGYLSGNQNADEEQVYSRRFIVHVPEMDQLTIAKQTAKLLLMLLWENRSRLNIDHPISDNTVELWITSEPGKGLSTDVAGEQFKNQIYLYDMNSSRTSTEWMREIAHEYGHFALPGVSGFDAPENWANGVLGERLFLKWLGEDLRAGRILPAELPFASEIELLAYVHRQVDPLILQIAAQSVQEREFRNREVSGMNLYTGFVLYFDSVYGSKALRNAIEACIPKNGQAYIQSEDFFRAAIYSLKSARIIEVYADFLQIADAYSFFKIYLPKGKFQASMIGGLTDWRISSAVRAVTDKGITTLSIKTSGWWNIRLQWKRGSLSPNLLLSHQPGTTI